MQSEMSQLIQYKILLTFVLQGKENMVDWILNQFELVEGQPGALLLERRNRAPARQPKGGDGVDERGEEAFRPTTEQAFRRIVLRNRLDAKTSRQTARRA